MVLVNVRFPIGVAPLFEQCFRGFQADSLLSYFIFSEMKELFLTLMKLFVKGDSVDGLSSKDLIKLDECDPVIQLNNSKMDFVLEVFLRKVCRLSSEEQC